MLTTAKTQSVGLKAKLFGGFAGPSRLAIVEALRSGPEVSGCKSGWNRAAGAECLEVALGGVVSDGGGIMDWLVLEWV